MFDQVFLTKDEAERAKQIIQRADELADELEAAKGRDENSERFLEAASCIRLAAAKLDYLRGGPLKNELLVELRRRIKEAEELAEEGETV